MSMPTNSAPIVLGLTGQNRGSNFMFEKRTGSGSSYVYCADCLASDHPELSGAISPKTWNLTYTSSGIQIVCGAFRPYCQPPECFGNSRNPTLKRGGAAHMRPNTNFDRQKTSKACNLSLNVHIIGSIPKSRLHKKVDARYSILEIPILKQSNSSKFPSKATFVEVPRSKRAN